MTKTLRAGSVLTVLVVAVVLLAQNVGNRSVVQITATWSHPTTVAYSWVVGEQRDDGTTSSSPWGVQRVVKVGDLVVVTIKPVAGTPAANATMVVVKVNGVPQPCPPSGGAGVGSAGVTCTVKVTRVMLGKNLGWSLDTPRVG